MTEPAISRRPHAGDDPTGAVTFTAMADGTAAEYELLELHERAFAARLPGRVLDRLRDLDGSMGGYRLNRLEHSLQAATRARRDGASIDWVVAALVHDIGDDLAPYNHSELAAVMLRPYVPADVHWVIQHHGLFQSYYYAHFLGSDRDARERHRGHEWFDRCALFCERWDQNSFDPDYESNPLESFEDDLRVVFGRAAWDPAVTESISASPF